jgi:hypothetical protein
MFQDFLNNLRSLRGKYVSTKTGKTEKYDSSYELKRFIFLDSSPLVKTWTKDHGIRIRYTHRNRRHHYIPDILVELNDGRHILEEIKGKIWDPILMGHKNLTAICYCVSRGWTFRVLRGDDLGSLA